MCLVDCNAMALMQLPLSLSGKISTTRSVPCCYFPPSPQNHCLYTWRCRLLRSSLPCRTSRMRKGWDCNSPSPMPLQQQPTNLHSNSAHTRTSADQMLLHCRREGAQPFRDPSMLQSPVGASTRTLDALSQSLVGVEGTALAPLQRIPPVPC